MSDGPKVQPIRSSGAAEILAGEGVVVHRPPLTVVVSVAGSSDNVAPVITNLVDGLVLGGQCDFGSVAEALQNFVVAHQPMGVAAVLDVGPDPIGFLFDQAQITDADITHRGEGRLGWNTIFISGTQATAMAGVEEDFYRDPSDGWVQIWAGTVTGGGARMPLLAGAEAVDSPEAQILPAATGVAAGAAAVVAGSAALASHETDDELPSDTEAVADADLGEGQDEAEDTAEDEAAEAETADDEAAIADSDQTETTEVATETEAAAEAEETEQDPAAAADAAVSGEEETSDEADDGADEADAEGSDEDPAPDAEAEGAPEADAETETPAEGSETDGDADADAPAEGSETDADADAPAEGSEADADAPAEGSDEEPDQVDEAEVIVDDAEAENPATGEADSDD